MLLLVGTYSEKLGHVAGKGSGIYVLDVDDESLKAKDSTPHPLLTSMFGKPQLGPDAPNGMRNPTYLIAHTPSNTDEKAAVQIYVVDEREDCPGTLRALHLHKSTGRLSPNGRPCSTVADDRPTEGGACCFVMVTPDEEYVLAANYICGSIVVVGRNKKDGSLNERDVHYYRLPPEGTISGITYPGPNAGRQERAHAHMVVYSRGIKYDSILVPDLGSDAVWSIPYLGRTEATSDGGGPLGRALATGYHPTLAGGGPRHMVLHPDPAIRKAYVAYELTSLVACFDIDEETGAIIKPSAPPPACNVLAGPRCSSFFSDPTSPPSDEDLQKYQHLLQSDDGSKGGSSIRICSDTDTSVAAIRLSPDATRVLVSSRIVGAEGAVSALPLTEDGNLDPSVPARIRGTVGKACRDFIVLDGGKTSTGRAGGDGDPAVVIAANQDTDEIVILRDGKEAEIMTKDAPTPVCLCVVPN